MKKTRIVITGLARDIEKNIDKNIDKFVDIGSKFLDYKILIFENDSSDKTRDIIKSRGNENLNIQLVKCPEDGECKLKLCKAVDEGIISSGKFLTIQLLQRQVDFIKWHLFETDILTK
jgi:hypothetical protein